MKRIVRIPVLLGLALMSAHSAAQSFVYVEPGNPSCPVLSSPAQVVPKKIAKGTPSSGSISVGCGFEKGSYTVKLTSTDAGATFSPTTFLVNFGSLAGSGAFVVTFATAGTQTISASIISNMGSPAVPGRFMSVNNTVEVESH
jgi:hypothetical protein